jgi:hypothetical protein
VSTIRRVLTLVTAIACVPLLGTIATSTGYNAARSFLATSFNLESADFARLSAGDVVSGTLAAKDKREVATYGVVRMQVTPQFYATQLADIVRFKKDEAVLQIGKFSSPPDVRDLGGLTLDDADVRSLRECRPGDCGIKLSADAINRVRRDVDWRRADAAQRANDVMRQVLFEYVREYLQRGTPASMEYADRSERLNVGREFVALVESPIGGWNQFSLLRQHLVEFPTADAAALTDFVYWSKEKVVRKTVVSITHVAIYRDAGSSPEYAIASKQIYGSHYFDASLGLTVLLPDGSAPGPGMYLAYLNRSRLDIFGGVFGGVARSIVSPRARTIVSNQLARLQRSLERRFAQSAAE